MQLYEYLGSALSKSRQEISRYAFSAPKKYKIYPIPKRTSGVRIIAHPARELKEYQRALIEVLKPILPVHSAAHAYKKNCSIKRNASMHRKSNYLLKMDFQNFFYNITPNIFFSTLKKLDIHPSREDKYLLKQLLFVNLSKKKSGTLALSIGAPSSPLISNFIMYLFDEKMTEKCSDIEIIYTRYADDITFSSSRKNILFTIPSSVKETLVESFDGSITINESKTVFSSKAHNRHVTGITLTNDGKLSIGRDRKRYISALIHKFSLSQIDESEITHLQGLLAFAIDIEPEFKARMTKKYSNDTLIRLQRWSK